MTGRTDSPALAIRNLEIVFDSGGRRVHALRGIDLGIRRGEIHGLVGESGSGKSVTARAVLGLLPADRSEMHAEELRTGDTDLRNLDEEGFRRVRGSEISMIFQEPARHLNPAFRIGALMCEIIRTHEEVSRRVATERSRELLGRVGLDADRCMRNYPHELSGGMKQRAMIAMALACGPNLLIADEPTTALDVTIQRRILELLGDINEEFGMSMLFISHDLGVVHEIADVVSVIYAGRIVETGPRDAIFGKPLHPYTRLLLASIPDPDRRGQRLEAIPGTVPDPEAVPGGCAFHPRCPFAEDICTTDAPAPRVYDEDHRAECHIIGSKNLEVAE